ncbi:unnamed protein product [Symbiodinium sp. CCMP2592]|nr:unnamed protein product [Symbiodinium sp. CCMP2592]
MQKAAQSYHQVSWWSWTMWGCCSQAESDAGNSEMVVDNSPSAKAFALPSTSLDALPEGFVEQIGDYFTVMDFLPTRSTCRQLSSPKELGEDFNELLAIKCPQKQLRVQKFSMSVRQCAESQRLDAGRPKIKKVLRQRVGWPPVCGYYRKVDLPLDESFQACKASKSWNWGNWEDVAALISRCF